VIIDKTQILLKDYLILWKTKQCTMQNSKNKIMGFW